MVIWTARFSKKAKAIVVLIVLALTGQRIRKDWVFRLAALGARTLGGEMGTALETIILASSVLYELIGPGCAKLSLYLSGSYAAEEVEAPEPAPAPQQAPLEALVERIQEIQTRLPERNPVMSEEEAAFLEAAEEQYADRSAGRRYYGGKRRRH